ncbi:hypothetical protein LINPERHAP1_LOCUS15429 [Linum perenne]
MPRSRQLAESCETI